jgi:hypothetical protein
MWRTLRRDGRAPTALAWICAGLLFAAGLTVFLPYYEVTSLETPYWREFTYQFTGAEYISGSYKNHPYRPQDADDAAEDAEPGVASPFIVVVVAFLGLVLLPFRRHELSIAVLGLGSVIVLSAGGLSLISITRIVGLNMERHLGIGFWLGALLIVCAALIHLILWRGAFPRARFRSAAE